MLARISIFFCSVIFWGDFLFLGFWGFEGFEIIYARVRLWNISLELEVDYMSADVC